MFGGLWKGTMGENVWRLYGGFIHANPLLLMDEGTLAWEFCGSIKILHICKCDDIVHMIQRQAQGLSSVDDTPSLA